MFDLLGVCMSYIDIVLRYIQYCDCHHHQHLSRRRLGRPTAAATAAVAADFVVIIAIATVKKIDAHPKVNFSFTFFRYLCLLTNNHNLLLLVLLQLHSLY